MLITVMATAACAAYAVKTTLSIARDQDVLDALRQLRSGIEGAAHSAHSGLTDASAKLREVRKTAEHTRQNGLLVDRVLGSANDEDRETVLGIFSKYVQE